jgi:hypothetical protein
MSRDHQHFDDLVELGATERQFRSILQIAARDCGITLRTPSSSPRRGIWCGHNIVSRSLRLAIGRDFDFLIFETIKRSNEQMTPTIEF